MLATTYPLYLSGKAESPNTDLGVRDKHTLEVVTRVAKADAGMVDRAITSAFDARGAMRALSAHERRSILMGIVESIRARKDEFSHALSVEAGKPIKASTVEVGRCIETFTIAAEEATRAGGEEIAMDSTRSGDGVRGVARRVPIGACGFITPFNFPLNLVAHKVAPAIAAGCPFVLKPSDKTPVSALLLGELLSESGLPEGAFSILPVDVEDAGAITSDGRLAMLSFTGSDKVGKELAKRAGMKRVAMELGGNAACVVDEGVDIEHVAERIVAGGYGYCGQSCISVQRVIAHESVYGELRDAIARRVQTLVVGDPKREETDMGPMIDEDAAKRVESWVDEAVEGGANAVIRGARDGVMLGPTLIENVPLDTKLEREEVFGPVVTLRSFSEFDEALARVNDSRFGLQAGVFTNDIARAERAWSVLEVGGVVINDIPSFRVDAMPYGGVKDSGLGREGPASAIREMTVERLLITRDRS
jgi:acyl-CoA reductase-like NAD-dependent aldehyde dehydrogenase